MTQETPNTPETAEDVITEDIPTPTPVDTNFDARTYFESEISRLKAELDAQQPAVLRARADLENFRRRSQQEVDTFKKYAAEKVVLEFLPVLDSFKLALDSLSADTDEIQTIRKGFDLIMKQFTSALEKLNVTPIEALNCPFDPHCHQAISQQAKEGVAANTVVQEVQKGFKLHDKVIRPSLVIVSE